MVGLTIDLRLVWRRCRGDSAATVAALLTVAVGVAAVSAVLAVYRAAVVIPFPYRDPQRLVDVQAMRGETGRTFGLFPADFLELRRRSRAFAGFAGFVPFGGFDLQSDDGPERLSARFVTAGYFEVLGLVPAVGRWFSPREEELGSDRVVVLSHRLFVRRFGGDRAVVGTRLRLDGEPWQVVGVAPPGIGLRGGVPDLWAPLSFGPQRPADRSAAYLGGVGRLAEGWTLEQAVAELMGLGKELEAAAPETNEDLQPSLRPLLEVLREPVRPTLRLLLAAAALVLAVGVVNLTLLLLYRARAAMAEVRVSRALGASRRRVARVIVLDALVLAAAGSLLGTAIGSLCLALLPELGGRFLYRSVTLRLDPWSIVAAALVAAGLAVMAGLLVTWRTLAVGGLARTGQSSRSWSLRAGVPVAVQVALSLALLLAAAAALRRVESLADVDLGFDSSSVLAFDAAPSIERYPGGRKYAALVADLVSGLEEIPGVLAAAAANGPPGGGWGFAAIAEGVDGEIRAGGRYLLVTPGWLSSAGVRLLSGRFLSPEDRFAAEPVAVLSAGLATSLFADRPALGERVRFEGVWHRIVGVVGDVRGRGDEEPGRHCYLAFDQHAGLFDEVGDRSTVFLVRGAGDLAPLATAFVRRRDPQLPVWSVGELGERPREALFRPRVMAQTLGWFAGVALLLAGLGLYGTLTGALARRRFELGIRLALGAGFADLAASEVRRAVCWAAAGVVLSVPLAIGADGWLRTVLQGIEPWSWKMLVMLGLLFCGAIVVFLVAAVAPLGRIAPADVLAGRR